jgi:CRP-like cAMP-binding protein
MNSALVRKLSHFTRLSREDIDMLGRVGANVRSFAAREDIIREGERPKAVHLVHSGWACRYKMLEDGRRQIVSFFFPGDLFDLNIFILREMDHSIAAITPVMLAEISREEFETLVSGHPRITQGLWWESLVTAAIQREWTVNVGQRDASERLANLFCEIFVRLRVAGHTRGSSCDMPLTQNELADALGISTVHANRTLQELRAQGLIELKNKVLTILDMDRLKRTAMFNDNYLHLDHDGGALDANDAERPNLLP